MNRKAWLILAICSLSVYFCSPEDQRDNPLDPSRPDETTEPSNLDPVYGDPQTVPEAGNQVGRSGVEDGSAARLEIYGEPQYYWGDLGSGTDVPMVKITNAVTEKCTDVEVTFNPDFVDATYGTGSVGWGNRGHWFKDLYGSDHVEIAVTNGDGDTVFHGRLDLLEKTDLVPSGYATLGPFGGDGAIYKGDPDHVLSFGTSLDDNINYYGYHLFENSPAVDDQFAPDPQYPNWQNYVTFRITLDTEAFGPSGYGEVRMTSVHASPSKNGDDTIEVTDKPGPVPGSQDDPFRYYTPLKPADPTDPEPPQDTVPDPPQDTIPIVG